MMKHSISLALFSCVFAFNADAGTKKLNRKPNSLVGTQYICTVSQNNDGATFKAQQEGCEDGFLVNRMDGKPVLKSLYCCLKQDN